MDRKWGFVFLAVSALAYGLIHVIDKLSLNAGADPFSYSFARIGIGAVMMALFLKTTGKSNLHVVFDSRLIKDFVIIGVLASGWGLLFQIVGLQYTTPTNVAVTLVLAAPLTTLFAVLFFKEKLPKNFLPISFLLLAGVYLVLTKGKGFSLNSGDLLVVIASAAFAFSNAYAKETLKSVRTSVLAFARLLFGALSIALLFPFLPFHPASLLPSLSIVLLGGLIFGIRVITFYKGVELTTASIAMHATLVFPVITALSSYALFGTPIELVQWLGIALVLGGAYALTRLELP